MSARIAICCALVLAGCSKLGDELGDFVITKVIRINRCELMIVPHLNAIKPMRVKIIVPEISGC